MKHYTWIIHVHFHFLLNINTLVSELLSERASELVSDWVSELVSEWVNESEWVSEELVS